MDAYVIKDFDNRALSVVYESPKKRDAEKALERYKRGDCDLYTEVGGVLYRVICRQINVVSEWEKAR